MPDLTPEKLAELRRRAEACPMPDNDPDILSEWYEIENLGERNYPIPPIDAAFIAAASPDVVLGLLDRLVHMTEARDNARAEGERLTAFLDGRCLSDITHRDEEHRQSVCMLPEGHAPLMHDDCMGCTWTDADHWQQSAVDRADELEAAVERVRKVAEHYAGLTNVDAASAILRALDGTQP